MNLTFRHKQCLLSPEVFFLNKTTNEAAVKYILSTAASENALAKKRLVWDAARGLWKNLDNGRYSPGQSRLDKFVGTAMVAGRHARAGGLNWTQQNNDNWVFQIITYQASIDGICQNHPICKTTVLQALHRKGYRFIQARKGWNNL